MKAMFLLFCSLLQFRMVPDEPSAEPAAPATEPVPTVAVDPVVSDADAVAPDVVEPAAAVVPTDDADNSGLLARIESLTNRGEQWILDNLHAAVAAIESALAPKPPAD